jgi:hypothetical protein
LKTQTVFAEQLQANCVASFRCIIVGANSLNFNRISNQNSGLRHKNPEKNRLISMGPFAWIKKTNAGGLFKSVKFDVIEVSGARFLDTTNLGSGDRTRLAGAAGGLAA